MLRLERRYQWGGESHRVRAHIEGSRLHLELDGRPGSFEIVPGPSGAFVLTDGDRVLAGHAVASHGKVWVQLDGRTYVLQVEKPARPRGGAEGSAGGEVLSPMTGTVRKVLVEAGQAVAAGTALLVVEAMKMEFTVTAPGDGRVGEVKCGVGESVDLGEPLIRLVTLSEAGAGARPASGA